MSEVQLGDWIICNRERPSKGNWAKYVGRTGRVVTVASPWRTNDDHEYGVCFTANTSEKISWFTGDELVKVVKPKSMSNIRIHTDRVRS